MLLAVYLFQRFNYLQFVADVVGHETSLHPWGVFVFNRAVRLTLNDSACLILIWAFFRERKYIRLAGLIFIFELLVILPLYCWIKLTVEGDTEHSSPILSQIHRLIVNPMLMFLLMVAFLYQKRMSKL